MTALPVHTVQHVKAVFSKYQIIALLLTTLTILAALVAALSGFQLTKLRKAQQVETKAAAVPIAPTPAPVKDAMEKQIKILENQLAAEKSTSQELRAKIQELEKSVAAAKASAAPQAHPAPPPTKPAAGAPGESTPVQIQKAVEGKAAPMIPKAATAEGPTNATTPAVTPAQPSNAVEQPMPQPAQKSEMAPSDSLPKPEAAPGAAPQTETAPEQGDKPAQPLKGEPLPSSGQNTEAENPPKP